jgi:hypothetical protein
MISGTQIQSPEKTGNKMHISTTTWIQSLIASSRKKHKRLKPNTQNARLWKRSTSAHIQQKRGKKPPTKTKSTETSNSNNTREHTKNAGKTTTILTTTTKSTKTQCKIS